jgi:hypothetical protein
MRHFDNRRILYGALFSGNVHLGDCRAEVITSELDCEAQQLTITAFEGSFADLVRARKTDEYFEFKNQSGNEHTAIKGDFPAISWGDSHDEVLRLKVIDYSEHHQIREEPSSICSFGYHIPPSEIYERSGFKSKHYKKGLLYGWEGWKREDDKKYPSDEWIQTTYPISSTELKASCTPAVLFAETSIDGIESTVVVDDMVLEITGPSDGISLPEAKLRVDVWVEDFLKTLSFLEGRRVLWHASSAISTNANGASVEELKSFKYLPRPRKATPDINRIHRMNSNLRSFHGILLEAYRHLDSVKKATTEKLIDRFLIARSAAAVDTRLIYWHSCLDVLIKEHHIDTREPFSRRLWNLLLLSKVEWKDIYPEISQAHIDNKGEFPINTLRNKMLHEGEYPDDYSPVFEEIRRARALCERLISAFIGVDCSNAGFGNP